MITDHDIARETACSTLGDLVSWEPVEHASGRRGRRYIFQSARPVRVGAKPQTFEVRVLLAG
jgi:hypothetical protein